MYKITVTAEVEFNIDEVLIQKIKNKSIEEVAERLEVLVNTKLYDAFDKKDLNDWRIKITSTTTEIEEE